MNNYHLIEELSADWRFICRVKNSLQWRTICSSNSGLQSENSSADNFSICRSNTSSEVLKLQSNFIEITLRHGSSPVNLLHIFRIPFTKNTSGCFRFFDLMSWYSFDLQIIFRSADYSLICSWNTFSISRSKFFYLIRILWYLDRTQCILFLKSK